MRRDSSETKRKILTACVRLFLEQGYKNTSVSQIVDEAGVARGSYLNLFPTKDKILLDLTETMFGGQFGTAGLMRSYMARKCDIHFPLERKINRFLTAALRVYKVPADEQTQVLAFIQTLDIKAIATEVMYKLFAMLEMKYDFKLSRDGETEVTT